MRRSLPVTWLKRSPDTATPDEVRRFQLHFIESGTSICNRNRIMTGPILFRVTLRRHDLAAEVWHLKEPQKLRRAEWCEILSRSSVVHDWPSADVLGSFRRRGTEPEERHSAILCAAGTADECRHGLPCLKTLRQPMRDKFACAREAHGTS